MEDFPLLYSGGLLLPPGTYNHQLNLVNIDGITFWSKGFSAGNNFMEAGWPLRMTHPEAIST